MHIQQLHKVCLPSAGVEFSIVVLAASVLKGIINFMLL